ncbi:MAG TPA: riboflavin synthase [Terriglobales bacterium]|jgi:riboflavin synthase
MFTGIIEEVGRITSIVKERGTQRITIEAQNTPQQLKVGDSVAVSGVCLTAVRIGEKSFGADLAEETVNLTSFSRIAQGALVNLELPMKADGRFGGHVVQGHVDGTGKFVGLEPIPGAEDFWLHLEIPGELAKYVVYKGSISIEGISLTVAKVEGVRVVIAIIPHTAQATNLISLKRGDPINIETDIIAKYVEKMIGERSAPTSTMKVEDLVSQGF